MLLRANALHRACARTQNSTSRCWACGRNVLIARMSLQGYHYEMFKYEKNGTRTNIARSHMLPIEPVQADVHVPGGMWYLDVSLCCKQL